MIELIKFVSSQFRARNSSPISSYKNLKVHPFEVKFDKHTNEPYVIITPATKYKSHKCFLEDLIDDDFLLSKLEEKSYRYVFYAYGMLRATEKNNIYVLQEKLLLNKQIKVKNLKTFEFEEWNRNDFENKYMLLDKKSLKSASEFFIQQSISKENIESTEIISSLKLKLVK